jgi:DNA-binding NarL/FixJ family response regulator
MKENTMNDTSSARSAAPAASERPDGAPSQIGVLIVDDHSAVRLGMRALIGDQPDMRVVAEARSVSEGSSLLDVPIDVAVVDYHLRDGRDGLALVADVRRRRSAPRTLVYSAFADSVLAVMTVIAGADGMLGKHELGDELCNAIRRVARGHLHLPAIAPAVANAMRSRLNPRDQAIFAMLLHGVAPTTIAERLAMSPQQLARQRTEILRALKPVRADSMWNDAVPLDYERRTRRVSAAR